MQSNLSATSALQSQSRVADKFKQSVSQAKNTLDREQLKNACRDFEAILVKKMFDAMRKTVDRSDLIKKNQGEEIFEDLLYDEYSKNLSQTSELGLSDILYERLLDQHDLRPAENQGLPA